MTVHYLLEICGDGINAGVNECDDGNTLSHDGCSSKCRIESGWACTQSNSGGVDSCMDTRPIRFYASVITANYSLVVRFNKNVTLDKQQYANELFKFEIKQSEYCKVSIDDSILINASEKISRLVLPFTTNCSIEKGYQVQLKLNNLSHFNDTYGNSLAYHDLTLMKLKLRVNTAQSSIESTTSSISAASQISKVTSIMMAISSILLYTDHPAHSP